MINRPSVIDIDSNEFDSFLGKKAKARRQERRANKQGQTSPNDNLLAPVDPSIAGQLPTQFGKKPKANRPMPRFKDKQSELEWLKVNDPEKYAEEMAKQNASPTTSSTLKSETTEQNDSMGGSKKFIYIGIGVLALAGIVYFVTKKKK